MKLLLHTCCAPCLTYPYKILSEEGMQVSAFSYNPNIHPFTEYAKRLNCVKDYTEEKERLLFNKEKLENENEDIIKSLRKKEIENMAYLTILLFIVFVVIFITLT